MANLTLREAIIKTIDRNTGSVFTNELHQLTGIHQCSIARTLKKTFGFHKTAGKTSHRYVNPRYLNELKVKGVLMTQTQCPHCGKYLSTVNVEETRLNNLYKTNNTAGWAKGQLKILLEMAEDHNLPGWYTGELKRIMNGISVTS